MSRKHPLSVSLASGRLKITVGIETLANATRFMPELCGWDHEQGSPTGPRVTDAKVFVAAVLQELLWEKEDGTTLVHEMFDAAIMRAIENGAEGIEMPEDEAPA